MMTFQHFGLYFTPEHVQVARREREREPFNAAWEMLLDSASHPGAPASVQLNGFLFRFHDDIDAGAAAVEALQSGMGLYDTQPPLDLEALAMNVILAHCFELVRDHPAWTPETHNDWLASYAAQVNSLNREVTATLVEQVWQALVNVAAGIVLEDAARFDAGAAVYRQVIDAEIRPEGYMPLAVEGNDGWGFYRQMMSVCALVLIAEAALHAGLDLWGYTARGVSVLTAASYLIYYAYYPEQWRWETLTENDVKPLFQESGAFLEMLNHRARPKDLKPLLDDLRPCYGLAAGGLTTLSHGLPQRRGLLR